MEKIKRKLTEQECEEIGGHFWKYWTAADVIDPKTFNTTLNHLMIYSPQQLTKYRGCPVCGKIQYLKPEEWIDDEYDNKK